MCILGSANTLKVSFNLSRMMIKYKKELWTIALPQWRSGEGIRMKLNSKRVDLEYQPGEEIFT